MDLKTFLVKAKIDTYASMGEEKEITLEDGSKEFIYESGEWKYRDRYFGFNPFIGEEVVWKEGKVIWGMNYCGRVISDTIPIQKVYGFLKKAMRQVGGDRPFRGPTAFQEGVLRYTDESEGSVKEFSGIEKIYSQGKQVYELKYHGGMIKNYPVTI